MAAAFAFAVAAFSARVGGLSPAASAAAASFSWLAFDAKSLPGLLPTLDDGDDDDGGGGGGGASGGGHAPWRGSILQRLRCRVRARDERFRDYVSPSSALSRFSRKTDLT